MVQRVCDFEGKKVISVCAAQKWFKKFNEAQTDLKDEPRLGRPMKVNTGAIHDAVETNPSTSTCRLSTKLDIPQTPVFWHLNVTGNVNRSCREVQHDLKENQAQYRVDTYQKLLRNLRDDHFIRWIEMKSEFILETQASKISVWIPDKWRNW